MSEHYEPKGGYRKWGEAIPEPIRKSNFILENSAEIVAMREGHMYQIIGGKVVEVVREGEKLVPYVKETVDDQDSVV